MEKKNVPQYEFLNLHNWETIRADDILVAELESPNSRHGQDVLKIGDIISPETPKLLIRGGVKKGISGRLEGNFIDNLKYIKENIDILNISIGGFHSDLIDEVFKELTDAGVIVVTSAGNSFDKRGIDGYAKSQYTISVANCYLYRGREIRRHRKSAIGEGLDFTCFGKWLIEGRGKYYHVNGTSFSSSAIAFMLAKVQSLMKSKIGRKLTQKEIYEFMLENTKQVGSKEKFGNGILVLPHPEEIDVDKYVNKEGSNFNRFKQYTVEQYLEVLRNTNVSRQIKEIHIHHTWKPTIKDYMQLEKKVDAIWSIWKYHTEVNKWSDIGQNLTAAPDNSVWVCRDINIAPASIKGRNDNAIAIEMIGNFDIPGTGEYNDRGYDKLEGEYLETVIKLVRGLLSIFKEAKVIFHREYSEKTCPGTSINKEVFLKMVENPNNVDLTEVSEWAKYAWIKAVQNGVNDGVGPKNNITEEQLMVFFDRLGLLD